MKNIMKMVFSAVFSLGVFAAANAQTDTNQTAPSPDDIVCVQVSENVFECAFLDEEGAGKGPAQQKNGFHEGKPSDPELKELKREDDGTLMEDEGEDSEEELYRNTNFNTFPQKKFVPDSTK